MILNTSRIKQFHSCRHRAFNQYVRMVEAPRSINLVDGSAFHTGVAIGRTTKDWTGAIVAADKQFDEDVKSSTIPPEQLYLIDAHRELVHAMLEKFAQQYQHEQYQIIAAECEFDVALPASGHNCIMQHWLDGETGMHMRTPPTANDVLAHRVHKPHLVQDPYCNCWSPHRYVGRTDAIFNWSNNIWIDDYKTTAIEGDQFWDQWHIDVQMTGYMYGVWKSLGIKPRGFQLNAMFKPSEKQVANWNSKRTKGEPKEVKDYVRFLRQGFKRSDQDLMWVERFILESCQAWEDELASGHYVRTPFGMHRSNHTCLSYNKKCDYWDACLNYDKPEEFEVLGARKTDYVDDKVKLVQLEVKHG